MVTFFVSGHVFVQPGEFDRYEKAIDKALSEFPGCEFIVGDCGGVDAMAQEYLVNKGAGDRVTVYHMFEKPRNLVNGIARTVGGFRSDDERDAAMTADSDFDIAFVRQGKWQSGTAKNIKRRHQHSES